MAVKISEIKDAKLQQIAQQVDNGDGVLKKQEYSLFAQEASKQGVDSKEIFSALNMKENGLKAWWHDVDKISTDGNDDGKVSGKEKAKSFRKGLLGGLIKGIAKNPLESALSIAGVTGGAMAIGALVSALTAGAIAAAPVAAAVGIVAGLAFGVSAIVKGVKQTREAKTDGEAKSGMENAGTGTAMTILSGLGLKSLLNKVKAKTANSTKSAYDELIEKNKPVDKFNQDRRVLDQTFDEDGFIIQEKVKKDGNTCIQELFLIEKTYNTENGNIVTVENILSTRDLATPENIYGRGIINGIDVVETVETQSGKTLRRIDFKPKYVKETALDNQYDWHTRKLKPTDRYYFKRDGENLKPGGYVDITDYEPWQYGGTQKTKCVSDN